MAAYSRRDLIRTLGLGAASVAIPRKLWAAEEPTARAKRPNLVFVLIDDMGWMDSSVYGSQYYETPNVDRLATRGMLFTDAYAANPLCSPTRASIMTGKYPARLRITQPAGHLPPLPDVPLLAEKAPAWQRVIAPRSRRFLPLEERTLPEALKDAGYSTCFIGKWHLGHEAYWPRKQGFDVNIAGGHYPGPPSYFSPYRIKTIEDGPEGEYITDRLTDEAVKYIEENKDGPFLLCFWHYAVHSPWQAKDEITEKYRAKTDPRGEQKCAVMGSMLESMDHSIGRLLDKLDELGIADDTILFFFSDNGGVMYAEVEGETVTSNAPLRNGKASIYEGGTREPCIVVWPGVVERGSRCAELISSIDFYPTMLEIAGAETRPGQIVDGESIMPLLTGQGERQRQEVFCHFPHYVPATQNLPGTYVRQGEWKLIRYYDTNEDHPNRFELYNLREDIGETRNLADEMPAKVRELDALITRHLKDIDAIIPPPNPAHNPRAQNPWFVEPIDGWKPMRDCNLSQREGALHVESFGADPHFFTEDVPATTGAVRMKLRMRLVTQGPGQLFWTTGRAGRFNANQRATFHLTHDGEWHEYTVELPARRAITSLRVDPGSAPGDADIDWIELTSADGTALRRWDFEGRE